MSVRTSATAAGFVGRADELAAVRAVVESACSGRADALLVQGDAGVGKTELVAHVLLDAGPRTIVVRGAALPLTSMTVPCLPLRSAVGRLALDTAEQASIVFDGPESPDGAPLAFDRWVSARCSTGPLVLAVDDLQWADESTLDVLMYLLAGPRDRALAVLLTLRRGEIRDGHRLNRWLADVRRLPGFQAMTLEPFDRRTTELQVARLVGAPPHQSLVDDVVDRARGNAYLTRLLVAGLAPETRHLPDALPTDLETAVLADWHRLSGPARDLTKVIAIGGRGMSATELAKFLAGESGFDDVGALLREAEAAAVLDPAPDGTYWFHHPLQAEALQRRVPDDERRSWHARFAARLEELAASQETADVAWLASIADHHHFADHPAEALSWARRAAAAAGAVGGTREQVRLLHRALELCGHAVDGPSRVDLLLELQDAAARGAYHDLELDAIEELLTVTSDEEEPLLRAELLIRRCHLGFSTGRAFMSLDDIEQALHLSAEQPGSWQYAWALAEMAHVGMWVDDPRGADYAAQGIAAARRAGHPRALSYANTACAILATFAGRDDEGLAFADAGRRAAIEAEDYWAYVHASSWEVNCIAPFTTEQGATHAALRRRELQTLGAPHPYVAKLAIDEADGWVAQGRWELAAEPLRIALGANPGGLVDVQTRLVAARLAAFQGRVDEALAHLQRADEICDSSAFVALDSDAVRAEVMLAAGDPEAAFNAALHGATQPVPPTLSERLVPLAARSLAELVEQARAGGGDVERALFRVEDLAELLPEVIVDGSPDQPGYRLQLDACAAWYAAELGRARRDPGNATAWDDVVRLSERAEHAWDAAYAGLRAAEAHLRAGPGQRHPAAESLRIAHRRAKELGAQPILEALGRLATASRLSLREVAAAQPLGGTPLLPGLTGREQEVLAHIVAGRTYREIARDLVVTEKTVSTHVSHLLRKFGATNRVELAQLAARRG